MNQRPCSVIKELLSKRGILILQFAFDVGMSETQASRVANGWKVPHEPAMRRKIAEYLNTPEAAIFPNQKAEVL